VAAVSLLWVESFAVGHGLTSRIDDVLRRYRLPPLDVNTSQFQPKHLFMLSAYLLVMGLLIGYLAEQQKQLRSERAIIARVLGTGSGRGWTYRDPPGNSPRTPRHSWCASRPDRFPGNQQVPGVCR